MDADDVASSACGQCGQTGGRSGLEEELEDRCENYAILSRLFREEVDAALLADLRDSPAVGSVGHPDFDEGYARIRSYLDGVSDIAKKKSELAIDYCGVFLGYGIDPGDKSQEERMNAAYPYESVYASGRKTLTSGLAEGVSLLYRSHGFRPNKPRILADDHMACELEFLQYLVARERESVREGDGERSASLRAEQLRFIEEHPLAWVEKLEEAIAQRAEVDFYPALALMAKGWLRMDAAYLKALPDAQEEPQEQVLLGE